MRFGPWPMYFQEASRPVHKHFAMNWQKIEQSFTALIQAQPRPGLCATKKIHRRECRENNSLIRAIMFAITGHACVSRHPEGVCIFLDSGLRRNDGETLTRAQSPRLGSHLTGSLRNQADSSQKVSPPGKAPDEPSPPRSRRIPTAGRYAMTLQKSKRRQSPETTLGSARFPSISDGARLTRWSICR
jgi:hypothetical protein